MSITHIEDIQSSSLFAGLNNIISVTDTYVLAGQSVGAGSSKTFTHDITLSSNKSLISVLCNPSGITYQSIGSYYWPVRSTNPSQFVDNTNDVVWFYSFAVYATKITVTVVIQNNTASTQTTPVITHTFIARQWGYLW